MVTGLEISSGPRIHGTRRAGNQTRCGPRTTTRRGEVGQASVVTVRAEEIDDVEIVPIPRLIISEH